MGDVCKMIGNLSYINHKVFKNKECPIKDFKQVEIINEMFWREFKYKINNSEYPVLEVKHLGVFYTDNSKLRKHIRHLIYILRKIRKSEGIRKQWPVTITLEKNITDKLNSSWKQLDNIRHVYIARKERKNRKEV